MESKITTHPQIEGLATQLIELIQNAEISDRGDEFALRDNVIQILEKFLTENSK